MVTSLIIVTPWLVLFSPCESVCLSVSGCHHGQNEDLEKPSIAAATAVLRTLVGGCMSVSLPAWLTHFVSVTALQRGTMKLYRSVVSIKTEAEREDG